MPTYQYACTEAACGNRFEAVQAFTDVPVSVCPACSGRVRKVFSSVGVVFKGSGFYRNDSRDSQNSHSTASGDGAKTGDSKSTSTDASGSTSSDSGSSTSSAGKTSTDTSSSSGSSSAASKAAAS